MIALLFASVTKAISESETTPLSVMTAFTQDGFVAEGIWRGYEVIFWVTGRNLLTIRTALVIYLADQTIEIERFYHTNKLPAPHLDKWIVEPTEDNLVLLRMLL